MTLAIALRGKTNVVLVARLVPFGSSYVTRYSVRKSVLSQRDVRPDLERQ